MSRVIAVVACGFTLAACTASLPSFDFFKSAPKTETLRVESEPPGADAKTAQGVSCRTPCELSVSAGTDTSVTVALNGYQPQTVALHAELPAATPEGEGGKAAPRLQPNPIYVELQPTTTPQRPAAKKRAATKKSTTTAARTTGETEEPAATPAPVFPSATEYPWPAPPSR